MPPSPCSTRLIKRHFDNVQRAPRGAQFVKVDLHVHTPASGDARWKSRYSFDADDMQAAKCHKKAQKVASQIVARCRELDLQLIGVTDHNTAGTIHRERVETWHQLICDAARKSPGKTLCVLPGVELSTDDLHLLVLLDFADAPRKGRRAAATAHRIRMLLGRCHFKLETQLRGDYTDTGMSSLFDVLEYLDELGTPCVAIPAHIDGGNKAMLKVYDKPSNVYRKLLNHAHLDAVEIVKHTTPDTRLGGKSDPPLRDYIKKVRDPRRSPIAWVQNSDGHSLKDNGLGKRFTYVRLGTPSFTALRNALEDPETRVRLESDYAPDEEKPTVLGLTWRKGGGAWQTVAFNRNLNCIIGKKGTHKTTLLYLLLYGLGRLMDGDKDSEGWSPVNWLVEEGYAVNVFVGRKTDVICFARAADGAPPELYRRQARGSFKKMKQKDLADCPPPQLYKHAEITARISDPIGLMGFLDRYVFGKTPSIARLRQRRAKCLARAEKKHFKGCATDLTKLRKACHDLYEARQKLTGVDARPHKSNGKVKYVELSLPQLGQTQGEPLFKVRITPGSCAGSRKQAYEDRADLRVRLEPKCYKPWSSLSAGARNAAGMALLMNQENFGPLIIDEPERHADVRALLQWVVPQMRALKTQQQIICVTNDEHVLLDGDAEQVIVMQSEDQAEVKVGDTNDKHIQQAILEIFEGGREGLRSKLRRLAAVIREES